MRNLLLAFMLALSFVGRSQSTFENVFDGGGFDSPSGVDTTGDGGVVICGAFDPSNTGATTASILRQDKDGNVVWSYHYGSSSYSGLVSIVKCAGGYTSVGYAYNDKSGFFNIMYLRIDDNGTPLAGPVYIEISNENCLSRGLELLSNGDYAVCGTAGTRQLLLRMSGDAVSWIRTWGNGGAVLNETFEVLEMPSTDLVVLGNSTEWQTSQSNFDPANYNLTLTRFTAGGGLDSMVYFSMEDRLAVNAYDFIRKDDEFYIVGQVTSEFSSTICIRGFVFEMDTTFRGIEIKEFKKTPGQVITKISTCTPMSIAYNAMYDEFVVSGYILDDLPSPQYNGFLLRITPALITTAFNTYGETSGNQFLIDAMTVGDTVYAVGNDGGDMGGFFSPADWYSLKVPMNLRSCNEIRTPLSYEKPRWFFETTFPHPEEPKYTYYNEESYKDIGRVRQICYSNEQNPSVASSQVKKLGSIVNTSVFNSLGQLILEKQGELSGEEMNALPVGIYFIKKQDSELNTVTNRVYINR